MCAFTRDRCDSADFARQLDKTCFQVTRWARLPAARPIKNHGPRRATLHRAERRRAVGAVLRRGLRRRRLHRGPRVERYRLLLRGLRAPPVAAAPRELRVARVRVLVFDVRGKGPADAARAEALGRCRRALRPRDDDGRHGALGLRQDDADLAPDAPRAAGPRDRPRDPRRPRAHAATVPPPVLRREPGRRAVADADAAGAAPPRDAALRRRGRGHRAREGRRDHRPIGPRVVRGHVRRPRARARGPQRRPEAAPLHRRGAREAARGRVLGRADERPGRGGVAPHHGLCAVAREG